MSAYDAADEDNNAELQEKMRRIREQEKNDVRALLKTPAGVRFIRRMFERFGLYRNAMVLMTGSAEMTAFRLGEQNAAQWLLSEITVVASSEELAAVMINPEERK